MKKISYLFLAAFMAINLNLATPQRSEAAVAGVLTHGAILPLAIFFYVYAGIASVEVVVNCVSDNCSGDIGLLAMAITVAIFNEDAVKNDSDKVRVFSEKKLAKDWSYSPEEKQVISNDLRLAASRFGKRQLKLDIQDQDPEVIVAKFIDQTGVSELTARYILAESGIQTER